MDAQSDTASRSQRFRPFVLYTFIAYAVSWAIEIPLALRAQGVISTEIPFSLHYLAAFGPFIAALVLTFKESGTQGLNELFQRAIKWRVEPVWWIVALSPFLLFVLVAILRLLLQGAALDFSPLEHFDFLPDIGIAALFIWLATYGFGEETGWRGYLLPRLQRNRTAWSATVILWSIWAVWHAPSFFYLNTASTPVMLFGFLIGVFSGAIFLTWLYNSSGGSILIVAVWHGMFDYVTACTECKSGAVAATISTLVMIWSVVLVLVYKLTNLSSHKRQMS